MMNFAFYMKRIVLLTDQAINHANQSQYELACEDLHNISTSNLQALTRLETFIEKMNRPTNSAESVPE